MSRTVFGCIEAGGTKFVAGIVAGPDDIRETARFDTTTPQETIGATLDWLRAAQGPPWRIGRNRHRKLRSAGTGSSSDHDWGHITATTKKGWSNTDFAGLIGRALDLPVGFDTDVNGAALAESRWGAGQGKPACSLYITIGTGIGGGAIIDGKPLQGLSHPEMGHIRVPRHPLDTAFPGICPFHGDCLEGLASGPAIKARWGVSLVRFAVRPRSARYRRLVFGAHGGDAAIDHGTGLCHPGRRRDRHACVARPDSRAGRQIGRGLFSRTGHPTLLWRPALATKPVCSADWRWRRIF